MIKELEYENEGSWYKGCVEIHSEVCKMDEPQTWKVVTYVEDVKTGHIFESIPDNELEKCLKKAEGIVMRELRKRAEKHLSNEERFQKKGYGGF